MKICWFCIPAHGHTNPTLALVSELVSAGHEIYYFSFEAFREKIEKAGATFIPCDGEDFYMEDMDDKGDADRVGKDMAFGIELLVSSTLSLDEMVKEKVEEIHPDIIVADSVAYWGKLTAMKYNIPFVSSTTTFAFNKQSAKYMKQGLGSLMKMIFAIPKMNKQIKRLQDKGYPVKGPLDIITNDNETNTIVYTSKLFQPYSETFSERYRFIGPSIRPIESPVEKTANKTIYISLGTVSKNKEFYENCVEAFKGTDYQVIISMGANKESFDNQPGNIQIYESVDQMAVLSIADAFITHCGMNSASEGLYFEVPLVLFPQTPEQSAVAGRTAELGAGFELKSSNKEEIISAVNEVLNNASYKENAIKISKSFKESGGVKEALDFLEEVSAIRG